MLRALHDLERELDPAVLAQGRRLAPSPTLGRPDVQRGGELVTARVRAAGGKAPLPRAPAAFDAVRKRQRAGGDASVMALQARLKALHPALFRHFLASLKG
jgi:hypothetical protein